MLCTKREKEQGYQRAAFECHTLLSESYMQLQMNAYLRARFFKNFDPNFGFERGFQQIEMLWCYREKILSQNISFCRLICGLG